VALTTATEVNGTRAVRPLAKSAEALSITSQPSQTPEAKLVKHIN
jgi:hypothetical protein